MYSDPIDFDSDLGGLKKAASKKMPAMSIRDGELQINTPITKTPQDVSFKGLLESYVDDVNQAQHAQSAAIQKTAAGETENVHEVMMLMDEAEKSFMMMKSIRDRLESAYHEIMRLSP